jgi:O-antigen ligase
VGDPNETSTALSSAFAFAFIGFERLTGWRRFASGALAVFFAVAVITSFSRGGFVAFVVVAFYCFVTSRRKVFNSVVAVAAVIAFLALAPSTYIDEIKTIGTTDEGTAKTRQFLWQAAFNMWMAYPILGVGGGGYNGKVQDYIPLDMETKDVRQHDHYFDHNWWGKTVHSLYFQLLSEQGLIGISLWGYIIFCHFRTLRLLRRDISNNPNAPPILRRDAELYCNALRGAMVAYLAGGAFVSVAYYPFIWYFAGFAVGLDRALRSEVAAAHARESAAMA